MKKEFISPKGIFVPPGNPPCYSHAVKVGNTIYVAGKTARDEQGKFVEGGFEAQAIKAFENLKLTLEAAGASLKDVVKFTIYLTNMDDIDKFREIRSRYYVPPMPASTAVEVPSLVPGALVEIEAVAVVD